VLQFMLAPFVACWIRWRFTRTCLPTSIKNPPAKSIFGHLSGLAQMAGWGSVWRLPPTASPPTPNGLRFILLPVVHMHRRALFAMTRTRGKGACPTRVYIGSVYVVASSAAISGGR